MINSIIHTARQRKWKGKWIWAADSKKEKNAYYYFRKSFKINDCGQNYRLLITADSSFKLFVNSRFLGYGMTQMQPVYMYYDVYDLAPYLFDGVNTIAVIGHYIGNHSYSRGALLAEVVDDKDKVVCATDASWKTAPAAAWDNNTYYNSPNKMAPYQEVFDARKEPEGWNETYFNDSLWEDAVEIKSRYNGLVVDCPPGVVPWISIVPRDIPPLQAEPLLPKAIYRTEESLDLLNRPRAEDIAPRLSMVGGSLKYSKIQNAENLCNEGKPTLVQCSTNHLKDLDFDGIYSPAIVLDFGQVLTARTKITLKGPAGGTVEIGYAERLIDGNFNIAVEGSNADSYTMKDGDQVFESYSWRAFRYLKLRFYSCFEPVLIKDLKAVVSKYPYTETGGFSSNDETLNSVFQICRHTIRLNSNEAIMDPWREQGAQWLGDVAFVTVPAINSCFGNADIVRKFFLQSGKSQHETGLISNITNRTNNRWQNSIPDYSLWWVQGLLKNYMYTGEINLLHTLYPHVLKILEAHLTYLNDDGLIENMPYWVFIDWADIDRKGICNPYNVIFYMTLKSIAKLSLIKKDNYTHRLATQLISFMEKTFNKTFYDQERGCYADARYNNKLSSKISEHGNMGPIWSGLCDDKTAAEIIANTYGSGKTKTMTEAQPFFTTIVLLALEKAGEFELALEIIRHRWGKRMVANGATSTYEEWYSNGSWRLGDSFMPFMRSTSHAWSAFPADFLIRYLLGVEIVCPGCAQIKIAPKKTEFDYEATFPTPRGKIQAKCINGKIDISVDSGIEIINET